MSRREFSPRDSHRARGASAEQDGVAWLVGQGYEIVERNLTSRYGELDVVARDGEVLCFVEIKARASTAFGSPLAAVTPTKQRRITRAAEAYLMRSRWSGPCRFDVLGMLRTGSITEGSWSFELVRDAFAARR